MTNRQMSYPGYGSSRSVDDGLLADDLSYGASRSTRQRGQLKVQHSEDSVDTAASGGSLDSEQRAAGGGGDAPSASASSSKLKAIWKKAVGSLIKKPASSAADQHQQRAKTLPPEAGSGDAEAEVDPVYSFLKLTADIPRQGSTLVPGDGHLCCSASRPTDRTNMNWSTAAELLRIDPSRCTCPCHLPEKLKAYQNAWRDTFAIKKS
jgi:hypothetical protein